ncbi:MAG: hypothetical protein H6677_00165 [Candidatus Obscuribacterales bacterium]|nr:hypothetical protein [Candidatus Obscuribacterales bacterium]
MNRLVKLSIIVSLFTIQIGLGLSVDSKEHLNKACKENASNRIAEKPKKEFWTSKRTRQYLRHVPEVMIRAKGPYLFQYPPGKDGTFLVPGDINLFHIARKIPDVSEFQDYVSVAEVASPFCGFQICRFSSSADAEKYNSLLSLMAEKRLTIDGKVVFVVPDKGNSSYWDYKTQQQSSRLYYCLLDAETIMAATSPGYFELQNESEQKLALPVVVGKTEKLKFFDISTETSARNVVAERVFSPESFFLNKSVPQKVRAIRFEEPDARAGSKSTEFHVLVVARSGEEDALLIKDELCLNGGKLKSIRKVGPCAYELTILDDPEHFYFGLAALLGSGIPR